MYCPFAYKWGVVFVDPSSPNFGGGNSCIARARRVRAGLTVYPPWIQIADAAAASSQSCDRKSKFGLRQGMKLI